VKLTFDSERNALWLTLDGDVRAGLPDADLNAIIDVSTSGRIAGIELDLQSESAAADQLREWLADPVARQWTSISPDGSAYIQLSQGVTEDVRSSALVVSARRAEDGAISALGIPRRGTGFEISYPSGNQ
jgi:uncharacterized protein YuzE